MANNDSIVSLAFKIVADSSQARGDFTSLQSLLSSGVNTLKGLFKDLASSNPSDAILDQLVAVFEKAEEDRPSLVC